MMKTMLIGALLVLGSVSPLLAQEKPASPPGSATATASCRPFVSNEEAATVIAGYLERMTYTPVRDPKGELPILSANVKMTKATHRLRMVIDEKRKILYVFLNRYFVVPKDHPNRNQVLQALMEQNWKLNVGRYEWDPEDGEVRLSYTFTTENGLGFEAFEAVVKTLLDTGDTLWPELSGLARR
jgi:hypothetical protein